MGSPKLTDNELYLMAGIDPKTFKPTRCETGNKTKLKEDIRKLIRIVDEQDAVNRYVWINLPCKLSSQELERLLYYKFQLAFFYIPEMDEFYFMPYALDGTIDFYGRFNRIKPLPICAGEKEAEKGDSYKAQAEILSQFKRKCEYDVISEDDDIIDKMKNSCVLLNDYTRQLNTTAGIPRFELNEPIIDSEAECIPFMRTSLIAGSGIKGMRVNDSDQYDNVNRANSSILKSALTGSLWTPVIGSIEFQELTNGQPIKSEEYMISMQSLDNFRLSTYGLDNGGLFEKKAHMLESENEINQSVTNMPLIDGLNIRQRFCTIANSIWGLGMWCYTAEQFAMLNGGGVDADTDTEQQEGEENYEDDNDASI